MRRRIEKDVQTNMYNEVMNKLLEIFRANRILTVVFINGMVIMMIELSGTRILAPFFGSSLYVWTGVIGVILACLSFGYWYGGKLADEQPKLLILARIVLIAAIVLLITRIFQVQLLQFIKGSSSNLLLGSFLAAVILFAPLTILLGMISPFGARLQIKNVKTSGGQVGKVYAAGTIGSIVGTFLTGYLLFSLFGNSVIVLFCVVLLLVVATLAAPRNDVALKLLIIIVTVVLMFSPRFLKPLQANLRVDEDSSYNRILVYDTMMYERKLRVLQTDGIGVQSGIDLETQTLPFRYLQMFEQISDNKGKDKKSLLIGGGAYTFPLVVNKKNPEQKIDIVEIDPKLTDVAKREFGYIVARNSQVFHEDGRTFLARNKQKYDVIYMDAFNSLSVPFQLTTREAIEDISRSLTLDGIVVANIISPAKGEYSFLQVQAATYKEKFKYLKAFVVDKNVAKSTRQNVILVASNQPINVGANSMFDGEISLNSSGKMILTDDYAPVEALTFY